MSEHKVDPALLKVDICPICRKVEGDELERVAQHMRHGAGWWMTPEGPIAHLPGQSFRYCPPEDSPRTGSPLS